MIYKYEQVTGMTVGQVIDEMMDDIEFYRRDLPIVIDTTMCGIHIFGDIVSLDLGSLKMELKAGNITRRVEVAWTDSLPQECVVWDDSGKDMLQIRVVDRLGIDWGFVDINDIPWHNALPITDDTTVGQMKDMIKGVE